MKQSILNVGSVVVMLTWKCWHAAQRYPMACFQIMKNDQRLCNKWYFEDYKLIKVFGVDDRIAFQRKGNKYTRGVSLSKDAFLNWSMYQLRQAWQWNWSQTSCSAISENAYKWSNTVLHGTGKNAMVASLLYSFGMAVLLEQIAARNARTALSVSIVKLS